MTRNRKHWYTINDIIHDIDWAMLLLMNQFTLAP